MPRCGYRQADGSLYGVNDEMDVTEADFTIRMLAPAIGADVVVDARRGKDFPRIDDVVF